VIIREQKKILSRVNILEEEDKLISEVYDMSARISAMGKIN
jgi:hypothetical protein